MTKGMFVFVCCLLLAGCGGSGGQDVDSGSATPNTAPILSGALGFDVIVQENRVVSYALTDAEKDSVTVSFTNKPEWIESSLQNEQLTLSMKPGFFDIKNHTFSLSVSDGKAQNTYNFSINVTDDPQRWIRINKAESDFVGQWSLDNGSKLVLYPNNKGVQILADGSVYALQWQYQTNYIELQSKMLNCITECEELVELSVVAEKDNLRRLVFESGRDTLAATATKAMQQNVTEGLYTLPYAVRGNIQKITKDAVQFELPITLNIGSAYQSTFNATIALGMVQNGDSKALQLPTTPLRSMEVLLYNYVTSDYDIFQLDIELTTAKLLPSAPGMVVFNYGVRFKVKNGPVDPDIHYDLAELVKNEHQFYSTLLTAQSVDVPDIELNTSYFSGFRIEQELPDTDLLFGGYEVVFTGNTTGKVIFSLAASQQKLEQPFTWRVADQQLILTLADTEYKYSFVKTFLNETQMLLENRMYFPFIKKSTEGEAADLIGTFMEADFTLENTKNYLNIFPNSTASLTAPYPEQEYVARYYKWRAENDGSMTLLYSPECDPEMSFSSCEADLLARDKANQSVILYYQVFKVIAKDEKSTWIHSSRSFKNGSAVNESYESIKQLINVPMN